MSTTATHWTLTLAFPRPVHCPLCTASIAPTDVIFVGPVAMCAPCSRVDAVSRDPAYVAVYHPSMIHDTQIHRGLRFYIPRGDVTLNADQLRIRRSPTRNR